MFNKNNKGNINKLFNFNIVFNFSDLHANERTLLLIKLIFEIEISNLIPVKNQPIMIIIIIIINLLVTSNTHTVN